MPYVVGTVLSVVVAVFARYVGLDRDRAFYPTVMIVIGLYYVLFAAMTGSVPMILMESAFMLVFATAAVAGFKSSMWLVVAALAGHGVFDALRSEVLKNPGVPVFWPAFCSTYDIGAAVILAWLLRRAPASNVARP
jgi:hypothetical protein